MDTIATSTHQFVADAVDSAVASGITDLRALTGIAERAFTKATIDFGLSGELSLWLLRGPVPQVVEVTRWQGPAHLRAGKAPLAYVRNAAGWTFTAVRDDLWTI